MLSSKIESLENNKDGKEDEGDEGDESGSNELLSRGGKIRSPLPALMLSVQRSAS